jgi:lipopolysaccharide biosynthesis regulator YciM
LDQGNPDEALSTLREFRESPSLLHRIFLARAYDKTGKNPGAAETTLQAVFDMARRSVLEYGCNVCKTPVKEWSGYCPHCQNWDCIISGCLASLPPATGK